LIKDDFTEKATVDADYRKIEDLKANILKRAG
jgi:hypothetical protein